MRLTWKRIVAFALTVCMLMSVLPPVNIARATGNAQSSSDQSNATQVEVSTLEQLQDAIAAAQEGDIITLLAGEIAGSTIKLPATLKNVTIKGADDHTSVLKDVTITAADGNNIDYQGLTFDGIVFDNSNIVITGWRNGTEIVKDFAVINCIFKNIVRTGNMAAVHLNMAETDPLNGFTFTNNVVDGVSGSSNSAIYTTAITGEITVDNNKFNNVAYRSALLTPIFHDGVIDTISFSGNTVSNSPVGCLHIPSKAGTDAATLKVNGNIFTGINEGFPNIYAVNVADDANVSLSGNYFAQDVVSNPSLICLNDYAVDSADLVDMGVFPIYKELNEDGTIDANSAFTPELSYAAQVGDAKYYRIGDAVAALKANGGTLKLLGNVNESITLNYPEEGAPTEITIDLNGFTVTSAESTLWVSDGYIVTVKDSVGTGKILSTSEVDEAIAVNRDGKVILEGGYISAPVYSVFLYGGNSAGTEVFVMNGGEVYHQNGNWFAIGVKTGKATINGGKVIGDKIPNGAGYSIYIYEGAELEITGGEFRGTIGNLGTTAISGGTFSYCDDPNDGFNAEHLADGYSTKVNADGSVTVYALPTSLSGTGTQEDPFLINNIDDLKLFRDSVNSGNRYNGQFVKLNADIDLNDEEWTPIGDRNVDQGSFLGTFDGDNHTISNLWITQWTKTGAGFFSKVGLQTEHVSGTVKNVTFHNVTIISYESYVGVIAQAPLGALIDNVHITGDVTITGDGYVGGIVGHGYPTINNSSVKANGTITANYWGAGAILGFAGDYGAKINNATVEGVAIHAEQGGAASVAGSPYGAAVNGATVSDVTITSNSDYCMGYVAGGGNLSNITISNVTATANDQPITPTDAVASVNGEIYFELQAAVEAAKNGGTVTLLTDISVKSDVTVAAGADVTIDLAGHDMTVASDTINLHIYGKLTINDSVGGGISTYRNHFVHSGAELVVNGGTLQNVETATGGFPINTNDGNATVIINDGTVQAVNSDNYAVRVTATSNLTVNGGTIQGRWGAIHNSGTVIINNGDIKVTDKVGGHCVYVGENAVTTINGGSYTSNTECASYAVYVNGSNAQVTITDGTFNTGWNNCMLGIASEVTDSTIAVKGGTFSADPAAYCAEGYAALPSLNDTYVVGKKPTATVNNLGAITVPAGGYMIYGGGDTSVDMPLSFVMQFLADQTEADMADSPYADWYGDFVITFTGIENGSFTADGCYLAGHYGSFGWVKVPVDGMIIEEGARYPVMLGVGMGQKYDYICSSVQDFKCAMFLDPAILEANPNLQVKLELGVVDNSMGEDAAASALVNNEAVYNVTDYTYEAEDFQPDVAQIGTTTFKTLADAFAAAESGDTVVLIADIETSETVTVPAGKTIILDLNGKTIAGKPVETKAFSVIENKGILTITGNGTVICDHQLAGSTAYAVNTITNGGVLTIDGATIENKSTAANQIGYAIDNNSTTGNATVEIKNGEVKASGSNYYDGIRLFSNSQVNENAVTVTGGTVSSIWLQNPSDGATEKDTKDVKGSVTISGGTVNALYLEPSTAFEAAISGGYVGSVSYFTTSDGRDLTGFITGGIFGNDVTAYCADGFEAVRNADGSYGIQEKAETYAAYILVDGVKEYFEDLQDAIDEAGEGKTVYLNGNVEIRRLSIDEGITLDLNGYTLTVTKNVTAYGEIKGEGLLIAPKDKVKLEAQTTVVPLWNGEGYIFCEYEVLNAAVIDGAFYLQAKFADEDANTVLKNGVAAAGITIRVKFSWIAADGNEYSMYTDIRDGLATGVYTSNYGEATKVTLSGADSLNSLTYTLQVVSTTGATFASAPQAHA